MDVYAKVTEAIIQKLEEGHIPWIKGWATRPAVSHETGKRYSFLNQMLLGHSGGEWATFHQVQNNNGKVKKGEHGRGVMFFSFKEEKDEKTDEVVKRIPIARYYYVFEIGQCEGIDRKYPLPTVEHNPIEEAEKVVADYLKANPNLRIEERMQNSAHYSPSEDQIIVPERGQFKDIKDFYSTLFHEMVHSTMRKDRANRPEGNLGSFGTKEYAKEELVAEIGSAYLCDSCGIEKKIDNSAAYIENWLTRLKDDKKFVVSASSKAEKAVKYILQQDVAEVVEE